VANDAYSGFTRVADRAVDPAPLRTRPLSHARGLHYRGPRRLPGPDSHRQAILNLSLCYVMSTIPSSSAPEQSRRTVRSPQFRDRPGSRPRGGRDGRNRGKPITPVPAQGSSLKRLQSRGMARAVYCHRPVWELGGGRRRRPRQRLTASAPVAVDLRTRLRLAVCPQDSSRLPGSVLRIPSHQRRPADRCPAWSPPNVSIDPIIEAGHRATGGDRRCDEAATRDSENARPRYA
jgi:hypothetical protein